MKNGFEWTEEVDRSFQHLKEHLACLLILGDTTEGEYLYLYLAEFEVAVSSVLVGDEHNQIPVYYVNRALHGAELRYLPQEKLAFTFITTARRLTQ